MSCPGCNSSSTTYSRCQPKVSTNCVDYQGITLDSCEDKGFVICKGQSMSQVQEQIYNKICELLGNTDVTEVVIPSCLEEAWADEDLTILNLFNFILDQQCALQGAIDTINTGQENLNPFVNIIPVCSCNCTDCRVTVRLTDALNDIITCLCDAKAQITALQSQVNILTTDLSAVQTVYTQFSDFIAEQTALNVSNGLKFICINDSLTALGGTTC